MQYRISSTLPVQCTVSTSIQGVRNKSLLREDWIFNICNQLKSCIFQLFKRTISFSFYWLAKKILFCFCRLEQCTWCNGVMQIFCNTKLYKEYSIIQRIQKNTKNIYDPTISKNTSGKNIKSWYKLLFVVRGRFIF